MRQARDGCFYTHKQFVDHYGPTAEAMWKEANGRGPADPAEQPTAEDVAELRMFMDAQLTLAPGPSSQHQPGIAGTASSSALETPPNLLELADAGAAEPSVRILFGINDLECLQQQRLNPEVLHEQARSILNEKIRIFGENNSAQAEYHPVTTQEWPTWREYIASLSLEVAARIVGSTGVIAIGFEQIEGTKDPNRGGCLRVDIVVQNADRKYWRLHPGTKRSNDAKPLEFEKMHWCW